MSDNSRLIVDALRRTAPHLAASIDAENSWQPALLKRGARVKKYREYERGDHEAKMTKQMEKILRLTKDDAGLNNYNLNYMRVIVDAFASRLFVSNISAGEDAKEWIAELLDANSFDSQQSAWFRGSIRDGDSYVMVDPFTLAWSSEAAYDGFSGTVVIYGGKRNEIVWACKLWSEADVQYIDDDATTAPSISVVVYQPDSISYWVGEENGAQVQPVLFSDAQILELSKMNMLGIENNEDGGTNSLLWLPKLKPEEKKFLPIVAFPNSFDNYTAHGVSELHSVIPPQNLLNRTLHDQAAGSSFAAFKLLYSIGFEVDVDGVTPGGIVNLTLKDKNGIVTDPTEGQLEFLKAARVGQFDASDISQYTDQLDRIVVHMSQISSTPVHGLTATGVMSGDAMRQIESALVAKAIRYQRAATDPIRNLIEITAKMQNAFFTENGETPPELEKVKVLWKSPDILDKNEELKTLAELYKNMTGVLSDEFYIRRIGTIFEMSQEEIDQIVEGNAEQRGDFLSRFTGADGGETVV